MYKFAHFTEFQTRRLFQLSNPLIGDACHWKFVRDSPKEIALSQLDSASICDETRPRRGKPTQIRKNCLYSGFIRRPRTANWLPQLRAVFQGGKRSERNLGKLSYARRPIINHLSSRLVQIVNSPSNDSIGLLFGMIS